MKWMMILIAAAALGCTRQAATERPAAEQGPIEVRVSLEDFAIRPSQTAFQVGVPYRFVVTNNGAVNHEFMIAPAMDHEMSMEEVHEMALVEIHADDLPPGATRTATYTFAEAAASGALEMACHTDDHYPAGMRAPITVGDSEAAPAHPEGSSGRH